MTEEKMVSAGPGGGRHPRSSSLRGCPGGSQVLRAVALLSVALALAWWAPSAARGAGVPIEGMLLVQGWDKNSICQSYFVEDSAGTVITTPWPLDLPEISPDTTKVAYAIRSTRGLFQADTGDIWVANIDGSGAANLTGVGGLGGVNCNPTWSPDGRIIAFQHTVPVPGQQTCEAGFQVWLMAADGSNLRQWLPSATYTTWFPSWAPDGYRLLCEGGGMGCVTGDVTGGSVSALPGVNGQDAKWSRDGSKIVYTASSPGTAGGEPGVWRQLRLADGDGSNVQVLVQQFLKDSDIEAHIAKYNFQPADQAWLPGIQAMAGPHKPEWSPLGDQVAFIAALPFEPNGPEFWYQREVWLYDLQSKNLTRLTNNEIWDDWLSWAGPNTSSASTQVKVNNTTVTFGQVGQEGWTSIIRTEDLPPLPASYLRIGNFHEIGTTAQVSGSATVAMSYADQEVAATAEGHLAMLRYDEAKAQWENITIFRDTAQNVIRGQSASLGLMGLACPLPPSHFSDVSSAASDPFWALWEIEAAYAAGIVSGYTDGSYHPLDPVTRDQMAVYISRALAGGDTKVPGFTGTPTFTDVLAGNWALKYIEFAKSQNVVGGYPDGSYRPTDQVDRGQMAVFIARAMAPLSDRPGLDSYPAPTTATFPDVPTTFWASKFVDYIKSKGVTGGYTDGNYHPEYVCTRDQMAVYIARAFELSM